MNHANVLAEGFQDTKVSLKKALISIVIVTCLGLQSFAVFGLHPKYYRIFLWPFTDYSMFCKSFLEGAFNFGYFLHGTFSDNTEIMIEPRDASLNRYNFNFWREFINALLEGDSEKTLFYAKKYERVHAKKLLRLELVKKSWVISRDGMSTHMKLIHQVTLGGPEGK